MHGENLKLMKQQFHFTRKMWLESRNIMKIANSEKCI